MGTVVYNYTTYSYDATYTAPTYGTMIITAYGGGGGATTVYYVFDATGNLHAINNGFTLMSHTARYVLVGLQLKEISVSHPEFHKREATLMSSRNATKADFGYVMDCIVKGLVDPHKMITHRLAFNQVAAEFKGLADPTQKVMKALIEL